MGILNVTPDSFYDAGRYYDPARAADRAFEIAREGAHILDIGGESTRPGSKPVSAAEEIDRVCPLIERIKKDIGIPLSVDTNKAAVAEAALSAGAAIVNDISGLTFDANMVSTIARHGAGAVLMHIQGIPETMQKAPRYGDLIGEILRFLGSARDRAVAGGIDPGKIMLDPGIGFGKTLEDNYRIIGSMGRFRELGCPVLVGLSRKSLIGRLYPDEADRLPATLALNTAAVMNGADVIRVHDVKEHVLAMKAMEKLFEAAP